MDFSTNEIDILKNDSIFFNCEKIRHNKYNNKLILKVDEDKFDFFKKFDTNNNRHHFTIDENIFYIFNDESKYAFFLDDDFLEEMIIRKTSVFYVSFIFPNTTKSYSFSFIREI